MVDMIVLNLTGLVIYIPYYQITVGGWKVFWATLASILIFGWPFALINAFVLGKFRERHPYKEEEAVKN